MRSRLDGPPPEPQVFRLRHLCGCSGCQHGAWRAPKAPQSWALCAGPPTGCPPPRWGPSQEGRGWLGGWGSPRLFPPQNNASQSESRLAQPRPYRPKSPPSSPCSPCWGQCWGRITLEAVLAPRSRQAGGTRDVSSINSVARRGHSGVCSIQQGLESQARPAVGCHRSCRSTKVAVRLGGSTRDPNLPLEPRPLAPRPLAPSLPTAAPACSPRQTTQLQGRKLLVATLWRLGAGRVW